MTRRAAGEGALYYDEKGRRWIGQAPPEKNYRTGKVRRLKVVGGDGESKASVSKRLRELIAERTAEQGAPETVGELVGQWAATLDPNAAHQSQGNIDRIDQQVRTHVLPVLGDIPLKSLTVDDVEYWLRERRTPDGEPLARSTLKKLRSILAQSYDYAVKRQYTKWNPARVADLPQDAPVKRRGRALTPDEIDSLMLTAQDDRLGAWVVVGITMGLRPGEVSGLVWDAVDFDRRTVTVYQAMGGDRHLKTTKTGRTRTLSLPDVTADALEAHRTRQDEERALLGDWPAKWAQLVFVTPNGTPLDRSNTRRMVQRIATAAGVEGDVTSYDMRHTASEFLASSVSMERLADLLGHRDTQTVQRHYRHPETTVIDVAAERWGQGASQGASSAANRKSS